MMSWLLVAQLLALGGSAPDPVTQYLARKQEVSKQIAAKATDQERWKVNDDALAALRKKMTEILGAPRFTSQPDDSYLEPTTLMREPGSDCIDGMRYSWKGEAPAVDAILVTVKQFLTPRYKSQKPIEDVAKIFNELAYELVCDNSATTVIAEIGGVAKNGLDQVRPVLALSHQDDGPFPPNFIVITAMKGDRLYLMSRYLKSPKQEPECDSVWNKAYKPKDRVAEQAAVDATRACYKRLAETPARQQELKAAAEAALAMLADWK